MSRKSWREEPDAPFIRGTGSSLKFKTGDWRTQRPVLDADKCIHCLFCWLYCPDDSVVVEKGRVLGFDYDYCKGCGICAEVCPKRAKAIEMKDEPS